MRLPSTALIRGLACVMLAPLLWGCGPGEEPPPRPDPPRGEAVPFRRVGAGGLAISLPGVMVIRDTAAWHALWRRFPREGATPPTVDFAREMVAAVSRGYTSGCSHSAIYVSGVERGRDTLFVVLGHPSDFGPEVTCAMEIEPVDLVVVPRGDLPVRFVGYTGAYRVPGPARWLTQEAAWHFGSAPSVAGRWQRVDLPGEWIEFAADGTFAGESAAAGTTIAGRFRQEEQMVTLTPLPEGRGAMLTLVDTLLVMEEGSRYRRVPEAPPPAPRPPG